MARFINGNYDRRLFNIGYNEDSYGQFLKIVDNGTIKENDQLECKATWNGGSLVKTWNATLFVEDPTLATCRIRIDNHVDGTIIHKITASNYTFKMDPNKEVLWTLDEFGNRIFVTPTYVHMDADVYIECSASKNYVDLSFFKGEDLINKTDFYEGHGTFYMVRRGMNSENKPTVTIFFQKFSPNHVGHYSLRTVSMDENDQEKTISMLHFYFALPVKPRIVYNRVVAFRRNQTDLSSIPASVVTKLRLFEIEDGFLFICRADGWQPLKVSWHIKNSLAVGHENGYTTYSIRNPKDIKQECELNVQHNISLIERFYNTSLALFISQQNYKKLYAYNISTKQEIFNRADYSKEILSIKTNRRLIVVCTEESLYLYDSLKLKEKLLDKIITSNPLGLLDLATKHDADYEDELSYLAFPDYPIGQIRVFDADCSILKDVCIISAYNEPLAALKFNTGGTKLATASEKGIVIKVFEVPSGVPQSIRWHSV
uniref:Uncharacterized protein n=1 Tax=Acrobeloides nanus TaxID=290746 RepID=A0A914CAY3_9BILA